MLSKIHLIKTFHLQAARSSFNLLGSKPIAALMTVGVIAIALALPALLWVFTDNMSQVTHSWKKNNQIALYVKPNLSDKDVQEVFKKIKNTSGIAYANLKSAEEGLAEFTAQEDMKDLLSFLPENPIPAVIEITPTHTEPAVLEQLVQRLNIMTGVDKVKMDREWITRLHALLNFIAKLAVALGAVLAFAVALIISNTLRFCIQSRHEEIQVLKLLGAKDSFIARPFLYSGILYSVIGTLMAVFLVNVFIYMMGLALNPLAMIYDWHLSLGSLSPRQVLLLLIFAIIIGWLGAYLSVRKQLASIEPAL